MHSYPLNRAPAVIEIATGDAWDAALHVTDVLERELGASVHPDVEDDCLFLPRAHEVSRGGRTLRGEEYEPYARACLMACAALETRAIRFAVEEMYVFDWKAFGSSARWAQLSAVYASLPGWLARTDLPRWFGPEGRKGPSLWASVEPPGLQVAGTLELARFEEWHALFLARTSELPFRTLSG